MIPTTVSSSPSTATVSGSHTTSNTCQLNSSSISVSASASSPSPLSAETPSIMLGLASLILEGRAVADDEFQPQMPRVAVAANDGSGMSGNVGSMGLGGGGSGTLNYNNTSLLANSSYGVGGNGSGGRQSPTCRPSTSRAAASFGGDSGHVINITTNPYALNNSVGNANARDPSPLFIDPYSNSSSGSASSSAESTHQRWTQKLCQLRQVSPAANLSTTYEQPMAVEAREPELVALAINESGATDRGEFEIIRRTLLNRANVNALSSASMGATTAAGSGAAAGSSSSSPGSGSENFLLSLQSLASTCLRSGSPSMESSLGGMSGTVAGTAGSYRFLAISSPPPQPTLYTLRANTAAASAAHRLLDPPGSGSSSGSGVQSPCPHWSTTIENKNSLHTKDKYKRQTGKVVMSSAMVTATAAATGLSMGTRRMPITGTAVNTTAAATIQNTTKSAAAPTTGSRYPQQGPHCDQFLRKMGLAKGEAAETEDHFCDMSYVNITCYRWQRYCHKMDTIIERGEPICIEVYLGPLNHKILLEQWIITQRDKVPPPTMTLTSLCSAIRSQLYFSQISAWCDLIKKSDKTIYDTGRIIFPTPTGAAGDLATPAGSGAGSNINITPGTSPNSYTLNQLSNVMIVNQRPRLNIFYRIKSFDSTACFNSKPNVHNFPNVNISENCSISVCLKSLPRINGGIPKIGTLMLSTTVATATTTTPATTLKATMSEIKPAAASTVVAVTKTTPPLASPTKATPLKLANNNGVAANRNGSSNLQPMDTPRNSRSGRCGANSARTPSIGGAVLTGGMALNQDLHLKTCPFIDINSVTNSSHTSSITSASSSTSVSNTSSTSISNGNSGGNGGVAASSSGTNKIAGRAGSCSNRVSSTSKHKCMFFIDEEELLTADEADGDGLCDEDDNRSDTANSTGESTASTSAFSSSANMSHREKQLMKYRKRMLKRDKKYQNHQPKSLSINSDASCEIGATLALQRQQLERTARNVCQPMEEGEEDAPPPRFTSADTTRIEMVSTGTQTPLSCCVQCGCEKTLVCLRCTSSGCRRPETLEDPTEQDNDDMDDSTASSISSIEIIHTPRNKAELLLQAIQRTPKVAAAKHKKEQSRQAYGAKLQNNNHTMETPLTKCNASGDMSGASTDIGNSNGRAGSGCQVCKRQKMQHNFGDSSDGTIKRPTDECEDIENDDDDDDVEGGKVLEDIAQPDTNQQFAGVELDLSPKSTLVLSSRSEIMDEESFNSSTKLTPHIDRCGLSKSCYQFAVARDSAGGDQKGCYSSRSATCRTTLNSFLEGEYFDQSPFNTSTSGRVFANPQQLSEHQEQGAQKAFQHKQTPKPNLLQLPCHYHGQDDTVGACGDGFGELRANADLPKALTYVATTTPQQNQSQQGHNALLLRKGLPKVNLTPIFCNPMSTTGTSITSSHSSPIPMNGATQDNTFCFDPAVLTRGPNQPLHHQLMHSSNGNVCAYPLITEANNTLVQKSFSAPTLPNSPSLSPRFAKQAAIYKRRSRHLSDRSDRSSLGSDEQISDDDLESGGMYSPVASPLKQRARVAAAFGRQPLLGNLEESLLQKRLVPKMEVMGFKVLLGASGAFCPTQLTIPATAYFYELHGETLSTPYVCEIRLPRKGYSVPRAGTVQATLLNPMGTVVRMFVIPYDMRDMPPLHQTFIRQRVLAEASTNEATAQHAQAGDSSNIGNQNYGDMSYTNDLGCGDDATIKNNNNNNDCHHNNNHNNNGSSNGNKYRLSPSGGLHGESNLGHFISAEHMKRLRYSIHLRFQTSRSNRLSLHTDIRLLISRRTDCDTAAAHAKGVLEAPNDLVTDTVMPANPKYSARQDQSSSSGTIASNATNNSTSTTTSSCNGSGSGNSKI